MPERTGAVVVGGGPAGLAAAIAIRQRGLTVTVVDRQRPPIDKACGEGLMPDGLARLGELGVRIAPEQRYTFGGIRYLDGEHVAEGRFPAGVRGVGVRRLVLHEALVRRAEEVGVTLRWGTKTEGLTDHGVETSAGPLKARWIIGADGLRSRVRRWAGLGGEFTQQAPARRRFGVRRHFAIAPWSDCVEVYWGSGCEAYVTPVSPGEVGVAVLWSGFKAGFDQLLAPFPTLQQRLSDHPWTSKDRGAGPLLQNARRVIRGRVALVGDASGYVDAITGEGLSLAFHQSAALADALVQEDLTHYARQHRRQRLAPDALTRLLLWVERHPAIRRRTLRALAREPALFSRLVSFHARAQPVGTLTAPRLLWRLVWS